MAIQYNITTTGTLTNDNGVLSGFSSSNYATIPNSIDLGTNFEMVFKFKYTTSPSSWECIFSGEGNTYIQIYRNSSGKMSFDAGNNNGWFIDSGEGITTINLNTDYYIKLTFNGTDYVTYLSTDGTTYTQECSATINNTIPSFTGNIGVSRNFSNNMSGSIDLNGCYIKVNGTTIWEGVTSTNTVHIQLRRDTLSNWTTVNPTLYEGEVGLITDQAKYVVGDGTSTFTSLTKHNMDTDISNLADTSFSNITNTAKIAIAHNAMPSNTYTDLTLSASGATYTAPADGWLCLAKGTTSYDQYVQFNATEGDLDFRSNLLVGAETHSNGNIAYVYMPMAKGQSTKVHYSAGGAVFAFRFIYAVGSESEAQ